MRRGLTLIELIFTMVIVGLVFMTVPKIVFVSNKAMQTQLKEDGIFDAVALLGEARKAAWDEKTIEENGSILASSEINCTQGKPYNDDTAPLVGQRTCSDTGPDDTADGDCDDLDDFRDGSCHDDATGGRAAYALAVNVTKSSDNADKTLVVRVTSGDGQLGGDFNTSFVYRSYNIGWAYVNRRAMP
ncbi:MAG: prepilin-type N-terminal cleavage/methylation domain-containing protein [Epsilonproteobacteria bacterium]|nr:prepilin-type N-terminal cleavage/methylation domain-containing protein [Campylobacterota bacterium]